MTVKEYFIERVEAFVESKQKRSETEWEKFKKLTIERREERIKHIKNLLNLSGTFFGGMIFIDDDEKRSEIKSLIRAKLQIYILEHNIEQYIGDEQLESIMLEMCISENINMNELFKNYIKEDL